MIEENVIVSEQLSVHLAIALAEASHVLPIASCIHAPEEPSKPTLAHCSAKKLWPLLSALIGKFWISMVYGYLSYTALRVAATKAQKALLYGWPRSPTQKQSATQGKSLEPTWAKSNQNNRNLFGCNQFTAWSNRFVLSWVEEFKAWSHGTADELKQLPRAIEEDNIWHNLKQPGNTAPAAAAKEAFVFSQSGNNKKASEDIWNLLLERLTPKEQRKKGNWWGLCRI